MFTDIIHLYVILNYNGTIWSTVHIIYAVSLNIFVIVVFNNIAVSQKKPGMSCVIHSVLGGIFSLLKEVIINKSVRYVNLKAIDIDQSAYNYFETSKHSCFCSFRIYRSQSIKNVYNIYHKSIKISVGQPLKVVFNMCTFFHTNR